MNVQDNTAVVQAKRHEVTEHCMCLRFEETATHFRVIYPEGYFPNGVQAHKGLGKAEALSRMLGAMERHWKENY